MKPTLAKEYEGQDPTGWLMSEKLDGVRAVWDGQNLISRNGNVFPAPDWFKSQLPAGVCLDGELFINRGAFQETVGKVRSGQGWEAIKYCVFDAPQALHGFAERLLAAEHAIAGSKVAFIVPHVTCENHAHMAQYFNSIVQEGGEGIMLRKPSAPYKQGRTADLLKFKPTCSDEGTVIGIDQGAVILDWRGKEVRVPCKRDLPRINQVVTFAYQGLTDGGFPRFVSYVGVRDYE